MMGCESGQSQLQALIISATSAGFDATIVSPHHPIACRTGRLFYEADGSFHCDCGGRASPNDARTRSAIQHSIALLLIDLAMEL